MTSTHWFFSPLAMVLIVYRGLGMVGSTVGIAGWVRTLRLGGKGAFAFIKLSDGSCFEPIQIVRYFFVFSATHQ